MPVSAKITVTVFATALVGGAIALIAFRGPAIILDMAASAAAFICM